MNNRRRNKYTALIKYTNRVPKVRTWENFIKIYGEPQRKDINLEIMQEKIGDIICEFRDTTLYNENGGDLSWPNQRN